jgi:asparagine synthase (glutamine-hydrolysing)
MLDRMQFVDMSTYLPDDILTKVDRASMGVSLECRVPLLDHRLVEFAWTIPAAMRRQDGHGKWPLRAVLYRYLPRALVDRPKMGFGVPIDSWLRGPLKEWAWSLLSPAALHRHGVLRPEPVLSAWDLHQSGAEDLHYPLWTALMLQDWLGRHGGDVG